jgi:hypothetical protein
MDSYFCFLNSATCERKAGSMIRKTLRSPLIQTKVDFRVPELQCLMSRKRER